MNEKVEMNSEKANDIIYNKELKMKKERVANNRLFYLDLLRVIACLSVILVHSSERYVYENFGSFNFWIATVIDSASRIAVPLFIMISGALMLDENYQFSTKKLTKHIIRMILFFVFWSFIYCIIFNIMQPILIEHQSIDWNTVIKSLITGHYHLWFAYLIIGLYLIVPLLRLWVNNDNKKYVEYFIILSVIFTFIIPQIIKIGGYYSNFFEVLNEIIEKDLQLKYVGGYTAYFILGWYINHYDFEHKKIIYLLGLIGLLISTIGTYILSNTTGEALQIFGNLNINILFQSIAVFVIVKNKFNDTKKENKIINSISKHSLGIYAIHAMLVTITYKILERIDIDFALINISLVFIMSFLLAYIGSYILSKIPILKKVV